MGDDKPLLDKLQEGQVRTEERIRVLTEEKDYHRKANHDTKDKLNEINLRLAEVEGHVEQCRLERKEAEGMHAVLRSLVGRIEKGETRDDLIDQRALKIETSVEKITSSLQGNEIKLVELKSSVDGLKSNWAGVTSKVWAIVQGLLLAYLTISLGWEKDKPSKPEAVTQQVITPPKP